MAELIGALRVSLSAETAAFEAGMKRAQRTTAAATTGMSKSLAGVKAGLLGFAGALSIGAVTRAIGSALEYAGSLAEIAQQLGVTTRDLQTFRFAAGQVGVSQEQLETGLSKLTITLGKVAAGAKEPAKALAAIGISVDEVKGKDAGEAFRLIADGLEKVKDRSQRAAVEVALFGKTGSKLDNLLSGGSRSLNELADAAEKLGIVLSDEQIQNADEAADKLKAVQTVISANIAGVVANNADAILEMANALGQLVAQLARAFGELSRFAQAVDKFGQPIKDFFANISDPKNSIPSQIGQALGLSNPGASVTTKLPPAKRLGGGGGGSASIGKFLAPGGGGGRSGKSRDDSLRDAFQFDQDIRRAQQDILRAQLQLAANYIERTTIGILILDAEKEAFEAELKYKVAAKELSQAQADQLSASFKKKDALERQALLEEEQAQRAEDVQQLTQHDFDRRKDALASQANIAETAEERRKIELELLQIAYDQRRQALQNIIDTSKDIAAIEDARRDLLNLNTTFGNDRAAVIQQTRGPMEDYLASLPTTAAKAQEALEHLQVQGLEGLTDAVLALSEGVGSATDALLETLKQFFLGLARLELQKLLGGALGSGGGSGLLGSIFGAAGSLFGGGGFSSSGFASTVSSNSAYLGVKLPGYASGGSGVFGGIPGIDRNVISMNGIPMMRVSYGERWSIGNDNHSPGRSMGGTNVYMTVNTPDADSFRRSDGQTVRSMKRRLA